jgi:hypothetical protein
MSNSSQEPTYSKYENEPHFVAFGGDCVQVELFLDPQNWQELLDGQSLTIDGNGYFYEGDHFFYTWNFEGGLDGELEITYFQENEKFSDGVGFIGTPRAILVNSEKLPSKLPRFTFEVQLPATC